MFFQVCERVVCRFMCRWFRGRTTCARCDLEFRPYPQSSVVEKSDIAVSKTAAKHSSAGQVSGPKDIRKPEPRPEEKVQCLLLVTCYIGVILIMCRKIMAENFKKWRIFQSQLGTGD